MVQKRRSSRGRKRRSAVSLKIEANNKRNVRRYTKRYLQLRNRIFLRDHYTCQCKLCEKPTGVKCNIHHIRKWSSDRRLRENKFNLITICRSCSLKHIDRREQKWETRLKLIARKNERRFLKENKTKEEILALQRANQILPDGFEQYEYKSDDEITKVKALEYYLRKTWRLMKFRTQNKTSNSYLAYGGRGITMCKEWVDSFEAFEKYVLANLGDRPEGSSIDRIDNDGNYEEGNIRWATAEVQGQNRRTTLLDEAMVAVILILYYKYKFKIARIIDVMNLPSRSVCNGVVRGATWRSVSYDYRSIITDEKARQAIVDYVEKT